MKKRIAIACCCLFLIIIGGIFLSYSISKERAENFAQRYHELSISPLKGRLILFIGGEFRSCWLFSGEYNDELTGMTFDVFVSFFGRVLKPYPL